MLTQVHVQWWAWHTHSTGLSQHTDVTKWLLIHADPRDQTELEQDGVHVSDSAQENLWSGFDKTTQKFHPEYFHPSQPWRLQQCVDWIQQTAEFDDYKVCGQARVRSGSVMPVSWFLFFLGRLLQFRRTNPWIKFQGLVFCFCKRMLKNGVSQNPQKCWSAQSQCQTVSVVEKETEQFRKWLLIYWFSLLSLN